MSATILLKCAACPAQKETDRLRSDPPEAVAIVVHCDRHQSAPDSEPQYLDAEGRQITIPKAGLQ